MNMKHWKVLQSMQEIHSSAAAFLCCEIDFENIEESSDKLLRGKAVVQTASHSDSQAARMALVTLFCPENLGYP